ncbi:cation diffusion facilitator family transporter [Carboxydochorda subterranea]|uniref:Cation diffusion facilitator family transporter n=1 Tax=Carboxydichorda subterranea TaxID=3109565 RepID=A0ABZ1BU41_9FIRM|nr:cation diffusion facilitator family transporter [Limnochorda sp. L945t]WRP16140.1 cation diffusion facilitator family transporter [Limnochorda sp. L945t]
MTSRRVSEGVRVAFVTIVINLALSAVKIAAGIAGRSYAVVADGFESLTDIGTTLGFVAALRWGDRPPDADHPYGHRRVESEITRVLMLALMAIGIVIGWRALVAFGRAERPTWVAPAVALLTIGAKEWMYWYTLAAGRRLQSEALVANAWHHRTDALDSLGTVAAAVGAILGWRWLDPLAGLIVAGVILVIAGRLYWQATRELVDTAPPEPVMQRMREAVEATPGVHSLSRLRARLHGTRVLADLVIKVDPAISVVKGHAIAESVERSLHRDVPELLDVTVHVEPSPDGARPNGGVRPPEEARREEGPR